ncbi:MAG: UDP-N-acetylenolpyruvoylglucosamine reductase [Bacteroidetes bacterium HGW-Bacteroidetes-2]|jgi:UDP-N-acetylmuramate dehydrogenase|nr:MAG: UDP-N-acetylenolpyruvoylglucosamine reductase [Bacteroidetes bacterium HGW-Bacteroidetes-2]
MFIEENKSLKKYNTFGIDHTASHFVSVSSINELKQALEDKRFEKRLVLGGGSNMLLTKNIEALVIQINLKGISIEFEDDDFVNLKIMAGENWHELVLYCLSKDYGGIENLSLIPGNTGTAPIQNIGAYGVEIKDVFVRCEAMGIKTQSIKTFTREECHFGYRDSIFKTREKGNYIITSVTLKLSKKNHNTAVAYGSIQEELVKLAIKIPTIQDISKAVIAIRQSKLPDPKILGNSGSFFKNPIIQAAQFETFSAAHPDAPFYKVSEREFKIPAGWLIEKSGFKGKRFGDAGVHEKQALVLVNYGNAKGAEILALAQKIQKKVKKYFSIDIETEVNIL